MNEHNESRLPVWARHLIEKLRADVLHYKRRAFRVEVAQPTNVYIDSATERHYLPEDRVVYELGPNERVETHIIEHRGRKHLQVWTSPGLLSIMPTSGNVILVSGRDP